MWLLDRIDPVEPNYTELKPIKLNYFLLNSTKVNKIQTHWTLFNLVEENLIKINNILRKEKKLYLL